MKNYNINIPDMTLNLRKNGRFLGIGSSAKHDWKFIFTCSTLLFFVMVGCAIYSFVTSNSSIAASRTAVPVPTSVLTSEMLKNTVSYYNDKAMRLASITPATETVPDPSL